MAHESAGGGGAAKRPLTVMAWLAGDTGRITGDLRDAICRDLDELREGARLAGDTIAVWAAYDDGDCSMWTDCREETQPTGPSACMADPRELMRFCDFVMERSPASQYALIVGSHGSGPKKQDVYRVAIDGKAISLGNAEMTNATDGKPHSDAGLSLDHIADTNKMVPVDLAYDDGSRMAMSIADLGIVCRHIASKGTLALVLLDACYMATVEVCEELAGFAEVLVASPESVPAEGMPYAMLLKRWAFMLGQLTADDNVSMYLGELAVSAFANFYDADAPDTQVASILAVDLKGVPELLKQMDRFADVWLDTALPDAQHPLAERTSDSDFAYLASFSDDIFRQPIIDSWASHSAPEAGLTSYLPERGPLPRWYAQLPISERPWGRMVNRIVEGA